MFDVIGASAKFDEMKSTMQPVETDGYDLFDNPTESTKTARDIAQLQYIPQQQAEELVSYLSCLSADEMIDYISCVVT